MNNARPTYKSYQQAFSEEQLPFAWLDVDNLDQNIQDIALRANNTPIRIASKSIRCRWVMERILNTNSQFRGIMSFHPMEAAFLADQGFDDLLIAYPSMQANAINEACKRVKSGKTIYFMVDSMAQARVVNSEAKSLGINALLCMDLDMSVDFPGLYFGVYRSPIRSAENAVNLYKQIRTLPHVELCSVMGYEAQIAGLGDRLPGKHLENPIVKRLKSKAISTIAERRGTTVAALKQHGADIRLVNGGGTGSIESTILEAAVTEVAVGSGFFAPHLFDYYSHFQHKPAAGFALEIARQPRKNIYTCSGGGYIASGAPDELKLPKPYLPKRLSYIQNEGAGEVQTPLKYKGKLLEIGSPVFFRHCKAGELCERFTKMAVIQNGSVIDHINTYRGDGQCFV
ncbi:hypothetical protein A9Q99_04510 [Gammaproteobacteria bacterium 45_16_T64]|nr:hypothetical protein A9Q99_04510 [Gammaproteobacteria bacterium 45_16_T64]